MKANKLVLNFLTLGFIGYLPAPGTMATLFTLPFIYLFYLTGSINYFIITLCLTLLAYLSINFINKFLKHDPAEVVIDEFIGCLFTFIAIKVTLKTLLLGFILFRIFDITKPFGIKRIEKLPGAAGILLDDIAAGLLSNILLQLYVRYG
ncbi:MAG: phosphatidylglycerophosphatase A [Candidatus Babeliales bacterium]|nr:phosphatidylglycerophosphatase A [Candidatus Babeliales bacterium]